MISNRFSLALHVVIHLAERAEPATSDELARCVRTNPVVIRRTLAGLRDAGIVASARGHGGGWTLARAAGRISLRDVYVGLGERVAPPTIGAPVGCLVEAAVTSSLAGFQAEVEAMLAARLAGVTVADVAETVRRGGGLCTGKGRDG
jgi:Rrf2 family protein